MNYLVSLPRRIVTVYVPLAAFLIVLLFPFYWMIVTTFKPNEELLSREGNPFWVKNPTLAHIKKLLFDTAIPTGSGTPVLVSVTATFISLFASVLAAYAIERLRFRSSALRRDEHLPRLSRAAVDPVHPARRGHLQAAALRSRALR
jgi:multiple sugar transport system permease protein